MPSHSREKQRDRILAQKESGNHMASWVSKPVCKANLAAWGASALEKSLQKGKPVQQGKPWPQEEAKQVFFIYGSMHQKEPAHQESKLNLESGGSFACGRQAGPRTREGVPNGVHIDP
eukprot:1143404-Pelagomonas_calceolata.AAC.2